MPTEPPGAAPFRAALSQPLASTWAVIFAVLAYGFAMTNFTLAGDDWFAVFPDSSLDEAYALGSGRWLEPLVWQVFEANAFAPFFSLALGLALLLASGATACTVWGLRRPWSVFAVLTLFVVHPTFTDTLNFKAHHVPYPLSFLCGALAAHLLLESAWRLRVRVALAAVLIGLALAAYQAAAIGFLVIVAGHEAHTLLRDPVGYWADAPRRRWTAILLTGLLGTALYVLATLAAWQLTGTGPHAGPLAKYSLTGNYVSSLDSLLRVAPRAFRGIGVFWFSSTPFAPAWTKWIALAVLALALRAGLVTPGGVPRARASRLAFAGWLLLSLLLPSLTLFLRENASIRYNVWTSSGLATGLWFSLVLERHRPGRAALAPALAATGAVLISLMTAFQINKGFVGLHLSNQRDLAIGNRILAVMEGMPQYAQGSAIRVRLVGRFEDAEPPFAYRVSDQPISSILNCGGLSCQNHLVQILRLLTSDPRGIAPDTGPIRRRELVEAMPAWPRKGSVRFIDGVFYIKAGASALRKPGRS